MAAAEANVSVHQAAGWLKQLSARPTTHRVLFVKDSSNREMWCSHQRSPVSVPASGRTSRGNGHTLPIRAAYKCQTHNSKRQGIDDIFLSKTHQYIAAIISNAQNTWAHHVMSYHFASISISILKHYKQLLMLAGVCAAKTEIIEVNRWGQSLKLTHQTHYLPNDH